MCAIALQLWGQYRVPLYEAGAADVLLRVACGEIELFHGGECDGAASSSRDSGSGSGGVGAALARERAVEALGNLALADELCAPLHAAGASELFARILVADGGDDNDAAAAVVDDAPSATPGARAATEGHRPASAKERSRVSSEPAVA